MRATALRPPSIASASGGWTPSTGDPRATMERLIAERYPVYAEADIVVDSRDGPHDRVVRAIIHALEEYGALPRERLP